MVRADHEDGAILNPEEPKQGDEGTAEVTDSDAAEVAASKPAAKPVVRKSSPLGRKAKPAVAKASGVSASEKAPAAEDTSAAEALAAEALVEDASAASAAADDDSAGDDSAEAAAVDESGTGSYRDKRVDAQRRRTAREAADAAKAAKKKPVALTAAIGAGSAGTRPLKTVALISGVVLLVAGIVLAALFAVGYQRIDRDRELRAEYATFARQVVVQMTTLNSENADAMYKLALEKTSGRAQQVFRDNMKQVTDLIREGDAVTNTTVLTDAVSKATEDEGTVLMVVGWESRSKDGKQEPLYQTFRYKVGLTRINGDVKVTDLEFVW
ncbi:hypothetical protein MUG78_08560 [Gordonia alkaliphila]|uniref:hypothetical protein n=1 Tax=Gordonia alkaliphila TaxID=1053547 RepID=UPI001FF3EFD4|nr:hypothetical protein [Gordonia alkaliphila]MCK0439512.1 hypothetical protein [Gordonia alkaliphila]